MSDPIRRSEGSDGGPIKIRLELPRHLNARRTPMKGSFFAEMHGHGLIFAADMNQFAVHVIGLIYWIHLLHRSHYAENAGSPVEVDIIAARQRERSHHDVIPGGARNHRPR